MPNMDLYNKIILFVGKYEINRPYFSVNDVKIDGYDPKTVKDQVEIMIEGEVLQGIYADDGQTVNNGYLVGGLTLESRYLYNQLIKEQE